MLYLNVYNVILGNNTNAIPNKCHLYYQIFYCYCILLYYFSTIGVTLFRLSSILNFNLYFNNSGSNDITDYII